MMAHFCLLDFVLILNETQTKENIDLQAAVPMFTESKTRKVKFSKDATYQIYGKRGLKKLFLCFIFQVPSFNNDNANMK